MAAEYRKAHEVEAKEEARKAVNKEALQKTRDRTTRIERKEMEDHLRAEITAVQKQLKEEFENRLAADVKQKLSEFYHTFQPFLSLKPSEAT